MQRWVSDLFFAWLKGELQLPLEAQKLAGHEIQPGNAKQLQWYRERGVKHAITLSGLPDGVYEAEDGDGI